MKIFGIIRNYESDHTSSPPGWCLWPDSAMLRNHKPTFLPSDTEKFILCPSLCLRISKLGKCVAPKFAHRYVDAACAAVLILREDSRDSFLHGVYPSPESLIFDGAVMIGDMMALDHFPSQFSLSVAHGQSVESIVWDASLMKDNTDAMISLISKYNTIKSGDLLLTAPFLQGINAFIDSSAECLSSSGSLLKFNIK